MALGVHRAVHVWMRTRLRGRERAVTRGTGRERRSRGREVGSGPWTSGSPSLRPLRLHCQFLYVAKATQPARCLPTRVVVPLVLVADEGVSER